MEKPQNSFHARELLAWYVDAGIDCALTDAPIDRFAQSAAQKAANEQARKSALDARHAGHARQKASGESERAKERIGEERTVPDEQAVKKAVELARSAQDLTQLEEALKGFDGCNLKLTARSTVFSDGNPDSELMIIGEAPGREEDEKGLPFVGRSGQLLDKMLAAIGHNRENCYITNVIAWRPPGNRTPSPMETEICRPFVEKHIELVNPKVILMMGGASSKTLLKTKTGILSLRGKWREIQVGERTFAAMPSLHPAYLLRQPSQKRLAWHDLLAVKKALAERSDERADK